MRGGFCTQRNCFSLCLEIRDKLRGIGCDTLALSMLFAKWVHVGKGNFKARYNVQHARLMFMEILD